MMNKHFKNKDQYLPMSLIGLAPCDDKEDCDDDDDDDDGGGAEAKRGGLLLVVDDDEEDVCCDRDPVGVGCILNIEGG
jgi:hypothetical protein